MPKQTRGYVHRVDIRAELEDVWQALIDPVLLAKWHVPNARIDAREGGSYLTRIDAKTVREAHIDVFIPPRRLRLIYMPFEHLPDDGAVLIDDFLVDIDQAASSAAGATISIVRLMGSGVPDGREWDAMYMRLRSGWERALLRLKVSFERPDDAKRAASGGKSSDVPPKKVPEDDLLAWPAPTRKSSTEEKFLEWPEPTQPNKKR
jgi:Activator of Hsp90 ATPase homolog 1-like protein